MKTSDLLQGSGGAGALRDFFISELKDMYWAEKMLARVLPKMAEEASRPQLCEAINSHAVLTQEHVKRIESIFAMLSVEMIGTGKSEAMNGLLKEAGLMLERAKGQTMKDAGIIASWQKIKLYEIAVYTTLLSLAASFSNKEITEFIQLTLTEEKMNAGQLKKLMAGLINTSDKDADE